MKRKKRMPFCPTCHTSWAYSEGADKCMKCGRPKRAKSYTPPFGQFKRGSR